MNRTILQDLLDAERVAADAYSLDGHRCDECLCLEKTHGTWHVHYAERGQRSGERMFASESDACTFMAQRLLADPSTRIKYWP